MDLFGSSPRKKVNENTSIKFKLDDGNNVNGYNTTNFRKDEKFNMSGQQFATLQKLIKLNEIRLASSRKDVGKSKDQLMIEKVEEMMKAKKNKFLEDRIENSEMHKLNKLAKKGDEYALRQSIYGLSYDVNRRDLKTGRTMLVEAAGAGQLHIVRMLCREFHASPRVPTIMGYSTALHAAVNSNHRQVVGILMTHGAEVNAPDLMKNTPLHYCYSIPVMKTLFRFGADPTLRNKYGHTPIEYYQSMNPDESLQDPLFITEMNRKTEVYRLKKMRGEDISPDLGDDSDEDRPKTRPSLRRLRAK